MLSPLTIVETESQSAAVIRFTIPKAEIRNVMGPAIEEVLQTVIAQGIGPAGPLFSYHFRVDPEVFDFEVGFPISGNLQATGRVVVSERPATKAVRTVYSGPYEGLPEAWGQFMDELRQAGHEPAATAWEAYTKGPESTANPAEYETELNRSIL